MNECICILGNLIYEGYVKGYIFQNEQIRVLVLKKDKTFPKLSEVVGWKKKLINQSFINCFVVYSYSLV